MNDPAPPALGAPGLIGQQLLARYTIIERIATGGMSVVYRGVDDRLHRPVCVKVFAGLISSQAAYQRTHDYFVQEAFALSQLKHPNTITIFDFGYLDEDPQVPFYVSELMTGGTLSDLVKRSGPLEPASALAVLEPIVQALAEAHSRGIIHRDIKPSNLLFSNAGDRRVVKLADFGIAKVQEHLMPHRASDTFAAEGQRISLYSPAWAAPEQLREGEVGPPTDVFALGLVLTYLLTGEPIFSGGDLLATVALRMEGDVSTAARVSRLPLTEAVKGVILKACRTEMARRYQTVEQFFAAARDALTAEPAPPPPLPEPPKRLLPGVVLTQFAPGEVMVGSERVRVMPLNSKLDLGGPASQAVRSEARLRLSFLPAPDGPLLHVKGLNCFVVREGRFNSATELSKDVLVELRGPNRALLDVVQCRFGRVGEERTKVFPLRNGVLGVPLDPQSVLLDFGPGREVALVYSTPV